MGEGKEIWRQDEIPVTWRESEIVSLYKKVISQTAAVIEIQHIK